MEREQERHRRLLNNRSVAPKRWARDTMSRAHRLSVVALAVVAVHDLDGEPPLRDEKGRVTFAGVPSLTWAHLVGGPNPGKQWGVRGMARPIQYLNSAVVAGGTVPVEDLGVARRAVLDGFTLTVDASGGAVLMVPPGSAVTVVTANIDNEEARAVNDTGAAEVLGRTWLISQLFQSGIEAARPERDSGSDLISYAPDAALMTPIQLKTVGRDGLTVHSKYLDRRMAVVYVGAR